MPVKPPAQARLETLSPLPASKSTAYSSSKSDSLCRQTPIER